MKVLVTDRHRMLTMVPRPSVLVMSAISSDELRTVMSNGKLIASIFDDAYTAKNMLRLYRAMRSRTGTVDPAWLNPGDCLILVDRQSALDFLFFKIEITV